MVLLHASDARDQLRELFLDLAHRRVSEYSLKDVMWAEFSANCPPSTLKFVTNEVSAQIQSEKAGDGARAFGWSRHEEGWLECAEKTDALTTSGRQHLGGGDAEIEVSFLEYPAAQR
jgi:hypothetical protein